MSKIERLWVDKGAFPQAELAPTFDYIRSVQCADGAIPFEVNEKLEVWDHVESAMALSIGGFHDEAVAAYDWAARNQLGDGSWWALYREGAVIDATRKETNFTAYIATGVWHHFRVTGDKSFLEKCWPMVDGAMQFVVGLQHEEGEVVWAAEPDGWPGKDALLTGNASIFKSLECAILIAEALGKPSDKWREARHKIGAAIRSKHNRFDRTWDAKTRYSMDWFYPVLTGVFSAEEGRARIDARWDEFVDEGMGCRCVLEEPWVTFAESSELVLALIACGERERAQELFSWLHQWRFPNGSYPMGWQHDLKITWPDEWPAWTSAAIILAADALAEYSGGHDVLTKVAL